MRRDPRNIDNEYLCYLVQTALLKATEGHSHKKREIASKTGRNENTIKMWLQANNAPGSAELLELAREYDEIWEVILLLTRRGRGRDRVRIQKAIDTLQELLVEGTE